VRSLIRRWLARPGQSPRPRGSGPRPRRRPVLEALEDRLAPRYSSPTAASEASSASRNWWAARRRPWPSPSPRPAGSRSTCAAGCRGAPVRLSLPGIGTLL